MRRYYVFLLAVLFAGFTQQVSFAQRSSRSSGYYTPKQSYAPSSYHTKAYSSPAKQTYNVGGTKYIAGENYKSSGLPKVERSQTAKKEFLKSQGLKKIPQGYEIDHVVPLSKGGADKPYNMQLLTKEAHKQKTASERNK